MYGYLQISSKKRVNKKWSSSRFYDPHPSMVSRVAPGRLPDPKASQNEAPDLDSVLFADLAFTFLETLWKYFVCSMSNNFIVLDTSLLFSLLRLGGKPTVDLFSMIAPPTIPPPWFFVIDVSFMISPAGLQKALFGVSCWGHRIRRQFPFCSMWEVGGSVG